MKEKEFQAFLASVRRTRFVDYLDPLGETAQNALERRLAWARLSQYDPPYSEEARFLLENADDLREVLRVELDKDDWIEEADAGREFDGRAQKRTLKENTRITEIFQSDDLEETDGPAVTEPPVKPRVSAKAPSVQAGTGRTPAAAARAGETPAKAPPKQPAAAAPRAAEGRSTPGPAPIRLSGKAPNAATPAPATSRSPGKAAPAPSASAGGAPKISVRAATARPIAQDAQGPRSTPAAAERAPGLKVSPKATPRHVAGGGSGPDETSFDDWDEHLPTGIMHLEDVTDPAKRSADAAVSRDILPNTGARPVREDRAFSPDGAPARAGEDLSTLPSATTRVRKPAQPTPLGPPRRDAPAPASAGEIPRIRASVPERTTNPRSRLIVLVLMLATGIAVITVVTLVVFTVVFAPSPMGGVGVPMPDPVVVVAPPTPPIPVRAVPPPVDPDAVAVVEPDPSAVDPAAPVPAVPSPVVAAPSPAPVVAAPAPVVAVPSPVAPAPVAPAAVAPAPVAPAPVAPAPVAPAPVAPAPVAPAPVVAAPAPVVAAPAPAPVAPAPAPVVAAPAPVVAAPAPVVAAPAPVVAPAPEPEAVAAAAPAPVEPAVPSPDIAGLWLGDTGGRSFKLEVLGQTGPDFEGLVQLQLEDGSFLDLAVSGSVSGSGALSFRGGDVRFSGKVSGASASGSFTQAGVTSPWSAFR